MEAHEDELGPIDIVVIAYPAGAPMTGEAVPMLMDLVERGIIRVLDALFVIKNDDGSFTGFEAKDLERGQGRRLRGVRGRLHGLLGDEDVATAAEALEPGSAAVMIVYENRWAGPFAAAVRRNGGVVSTSSESPRRRSSGPSTPPKRRPDERTPTCQDCFAVWPAPQ